ncbi:hypothetical protein U5922_000900 (plasmid) [Aquicoccus sp. G2-2]|uniref:hypothetical protein n=1 Tax=Aquicoccus sp. G2-2 TaxID=3092120 RepID=UPI00366EC4A1
MNFSIFHVGVPPVGLEESQSNPGIRLNADGRQTKGTSPDRSCFPVDCVTNAPGLMINLALMQLMDNGNNTYAGPNFAFAGGEVWKVATDAFFTRKPITRLR